MKDYTEAQINRKHMFAINVEACSHVLRRCRKFQDNHYKKYTNNLQFAKVAITRTAAWLEYLM